MRNSVTETIDESPEGVPSLKKSDSNDELDFGEENVNDNQINKNSSVRTSR